LPNKVGEGDIEYQCHRRPRLRSVVVASHNVNDLILLFSLMTYHQIIYKNTTMGATSGTGTAYLSGKAVTFIRAAGNVWVTATSSIRFENC